MIRSVRGARFKYIRNYYPHLPWFHQQTRVYPSTNPILQVWHQLSGEGKLSGPAALYMAESKPREMLFDTAADRWEIHNLVDSPQHREELERLRRVHREWVIATRDLGFLPEEEMWLRFQATEDAPPAYVTVRQEPQSYPLVRILGTADIVGAGARYLATLRGRLKADSDPTVRYWAATGIDALGAEASIAKPELRVALKDS
ncbi:MAG: sulfatase, partial [bacterium]|nr:sulfatase [bacterium]